MLSPELEIEITDLAARYGAPERVRAVLEDIAVEPLNMSDRFGEVCMIIRRPHNKLLTFIKTFYPPGCYRLLTGGVEHGEQVEDALWREMAEETGLTVVATRFLAVIEYVNAAPDAAPAFVTFAFLLDAPEGEPLVTDEDEHVGDFREIDPGELPALAATLENAPKEYSDEIRGDWYSWGVFRAVVHRVVHAALVP